jgi:hypothetical protein
MKSDPVPAALVPAETDEGPHEADAGLLWSESHYLDAVAPDAGTGCYVRLGRLPNQGRSHVMLAVARPGAGPVVLADPDAPLPAVDGTGQVVAAGAYRLELAWDAPLRQVRVTARGTAAGYAEPADVLGAASSRLAPGRPVAVELDLAWRTEGTPFRWRSQTRYEIPCHVTGQVTVDGERIDVDWAGQRDHSWGARDWWAVEWSWMAAHLDDGSRWHAASVPAYPPASTGYFQRDGAVTEIASVSSAAAFTPEGLFGTTTVRIEPGGHLLSLSPVAFAPVRMDSPDGRVSLFPRATCRVTTDDGRHGVGWVEWNLPRGHSPGSPAP